MTNKRCEVLLGSGNYFHWEYNMRMTLARKGLLVHVQFIKKEEEMTDAWLFNDAKALGIIAQGIELQHQTKIRSATTAMHAWVILRDFYNRTTLHNRVEMTRRLHEFKMENGSTMSKHLDAFDELVVGLQTLGEPVDDSRQLVVLLSSLPTDYELISSIVENSKDITLIEVKENLLKEHERLQRKETTEKAFPVRSNGRRFKGGQGNGRKGNYLRKTNTGIKGKCFKCGQVGNYKRDCLKRSNGEEEGAVFAAGELQCEEWLIDSGATSHMTPHRSDLFEYKELKTGQQVSIADGKKLQVAGVGTVKLKGLDG
uniref:CCHC-type domain-containing protein n=1 Tax=Peronospora matthiolae TaxID=2874970 RepID=A0AAV1UQT2_9STRA